MANNKYEYRPITWEHLHAISNTLSHNIKKVAKERGIEIEGIIAVARDGLVPALIVSNMLEVKYVDTFCISSYDEEDKQGKIRITKFPAAKQGGIEELKRIKGRGYVFIDDVSFTGETIKTIKREYPEGIITTLYSTPEAKNTGCLDADADDMTLQQWILFPWHQDEYKNLNK